MTKEESMNGLNVLGCAIAGSGLTLGILSTVGVLGSPYGFIALAFGLASIVLNIAARSER
jgi:hypothetical protein